MISGWLKAIKERALSQMLNGEEIPGFKVVEGRSAREWGDTSGMVAELAAAGYGPADIYEPQELLSPAKMEKSLGKKKFAELVGSRIVTKPGNPTIAPESDKRKPYSSKEASRKAFE